MMCHSVYTRSNFTMTLNVCTPYQSALQNLWNCVMIVNATNIRKNGQCHTPASFDAVWEITNHFFIANCSFAVPIASHWLSFFWAISVYGLRWSGKRRRKLELWRHQNKTKLQTYLREMTLLSYAKATKRFEKGLLIISIRLLIIFRFVLSLYFRGNIFLV